MIDINHIVFEYPGKRALKDVSCHIKAGSILALVGPNGAGKTTLMRCIAALEDPFSGEITINGTSVQTHPREIHRQVGYLSDFFGLYNNLTTRQCLTFNAKIHQIDATHLEEKVALAAKRLKLTPHLDVKAGNLSRGLRQRLGIAQAIIHEPTLLLLDEPASGLDPEARVSLSDLFLSLHDAGMTLVVSSHILNELEDYCTEMLLLRDGQIVDQRSANDEATNADGNTTPQHQVTIELSEPAKPYLAELSTLDTVQEARLEKGALVCTVAADKAGLNSLLKELIKKKIPVCGFAVRKKRLQDIYMDFASTDTETSPETNPD